MAKVLIRTVEPLMMVMKIGVLALVKLLIGVINGNCMKRNWENGCNG
jgi:hypothetical protein